MSSDPEVVKPLPLPDKPSIAVLTFQNMSADPEQEYLSDGIVEDINTALSRFKSLFVIARNSSFTYKGKPVDVMQVGRELGVRYVLEGSVRKSGGKVRITASSSTPQPEHIFGLIGSMDLWTTSLRCRIGSRRNGRQARTKEQPRSEGKRPANHAWRRDARRERFAHWQIEGRGCSGIGERYASGVQFQGSRASIRLIGWSAMRARMSRR